MSQRFRFRFGAAVEGVDGPLGTLHQVIVDASTLSVDVLVIRMGTFIRRELRVPRQVLLGASEAGLWLDLTHTQARELQAKQARRAGEAGSRSGDGAATPPVALSDRLRIRASEGSNLGHLRQVVTDAASGEILEYILESGPVRQQGRRLPAAWVRRVTPGALDVEASAEAVAALDLHRDDRDLRADILDAWFYDDGLRLTMLQAPVDVQVCEGIAHVEGRVSSSLIRRRLEARARGVQGVLQVHNRLSIEDRGEAARNGLRQSLSPW